MSAVTSISAEQMEQIRLFLRTQCGLVIGDARHHHVEESIARLMALHGATSIEYFLHTATENNASIRDQLANAVISRESFWFRDPDSFDIVVNDLLPVLDKRLEDDPKSKARFWSAGCSTGQEAYSLAIAIHNHKKYSVTDPALASCYEITGTDISPAALFLAIAGRYDQMAMTTGLTEDFHNRYFLQEGRIYLLRDVIRRSVKFSQHNLLDPVGNFAGGPFDVVFLRYVLEYYSESAQLKVLEHIVKGMSADGVLFLGLTESLPENNFFAEQNFGGVVGYRRNS